MEKWVKKTSLTFLYPGLAGSVWRLTLGKPFGRSRQLHDGSFPALYFAAVYGLAQECREALGCSRITNKEQLAMIPVPLLLLLKCPGSQYIQSFFAKHGITAMIQRGLVYGSSVERLSGSFYLSPIQWDQWEGRAWSEGKSASSSVLKGTSWIFCWAGHHWTWCVTEKVELVCNSRHASAEHIFVCDWPWSFWANREQKEPWVIPVILCSRGKPSFCKKKMQNNKTGLLIPLVKLRVCGVKSCALVTQLKGSVRPLPLVSHLVCACMGARGVAFVQLLGSKCTLDTDL